MKNGNKITIIFLDAIKLDDYQKSLNAASHIQNATWIQNNGFTSLSFDSDNYKLYQYPAMDSTNHRFIIDSFAVLKEEKPIETVEVIAEASLLNETAHQPIESVEMIAETKLLDKMADKPIESLTVIASSTQLAESLENIKDEPYHLVLIRC